MNISNLISFAVNIRNVCMVMHSWPWFLVFLQMTHMTSIIHYPSMYCAHFQWLCRSMRYSHHGLAVRRFPIYISQCCFLTTHRFSSAGPFRKLQQSDSAFVFRSRGIRARVLALTRAVIIFLDLRSWLFARWSIHRVHRAHLLSTLSL